MNINHVVETEQGTVKFQGTVTGPELAFIVETGINTLIELGAIPFASKKGKNPADYHMEIGETAQ